MRRSRNYDRGSNTPVSFIAAVILSAVIVVMTMGVVAKLSDANLLLDMFLAMIDVLPYGNIFAEFVFSLISASMGTTANSATGMFSSGTMTSVGFMKEFCKLCLSAGVFSALNEKIQIITGVKGERGIWNFLKSVVFTMLSGYLSAFASGLVLQLFFDQLHKLPGIVQGIISAGMSIAIIGSVFTIVKLLFFISGGSLLAFIMYFIIRYLIINIIKVILVYMLILAMFILVLWGDIASFTAMTGIIMTILIMVVGLDMIVKSVAGYKD